MVRVLAATLFLSFSAFAQNPILTFEANAVVAKVTPGARTAWMNISRPSGHTSIRPQFLVDADGDGIVRWETEIALRSSWAVVDMSNGGYAISGAPGITLKEKTLPNGVILRGPGGAYTEFVVPNVAFVYRFYLLARPGTGAWQLPVVDHIRTLPTDLDGLTNGITVFRAEQFQPVDDSPALDAVRPGDLLIVLEAQELAYIARTIDAAYLATSAGAGVLNTPTSGHANDRTGGGVMIVRTGGTDGTVSLDYQTADKTAKSGVDYTAVSGTVTFLSGEVLKFIDIPIPADGVHTGEASELELRLSNPVGTTVVGPMTVKVGITDGERPPRVAIERKDVPEGDGGRKEITLAVTLIGPPTTLTATVPWYAASPHNIATVTEGVLRFEPGETTKSITVAWNADDVRGSARLLMVTLLISMGENIMKQDENFQFIRELDGWVRVLDDDGPPKKRAVRH
ncbi:MAG TPA: Calx-beta domain-containing protein [Thermoanaerobaculia bacterium]|jgi:hypothetical protein